MNDATALARKLQLKPGGVLWIQLAEYGWKAVSQVSYGETLSALRVRPLKDGESAPT